MTYQEKLLSEIANKLKNGFSSMCCAVTSAVGTQMIPVYEYHTLYVQGPIDSVDAGLVYYPIIFERQATQLVFTFGHNVSANCDEFSAYLDPIQQEVVYRDSVGRVIYSSGLGILTIPTTDYSEYTIKFQIEIQRTSGFRQVFEGVYEISNTGAPIDDTLTILQFYSNSNTSNGTFPVGMIPVTYEVPVKDIYAIFTNGVFVKYVDMAGADYTPTYCLSTNPVMPFTSIDYEILKPVYDTNIVRLISGASFTLNANTVHNLTFTVMSSTLDLTIGATTVTGLPTGTTQTLSASNLITDAITFDTSGSGGSVAITYTIPTSL